MFIQPGIGEQIRQTGRILVQEPGDVCTEYQQEAQDDQNQEKSDVFNDIIQEGASGFDFKSPDGIQRFVNLVKSTGGGQCKGCNAEDGGKFAVMIQMLTSDKVLNLKCGLMTHIHLQLRVQFARNGVFFE